MCLQACPPRSLPEVLAILVSPYDMNVHKQGLPERSLHSVTSLPASMLLSCSRTTTFWSLFRRDTLSFVLQANFLPWVRRFSVFCRGLGPASGASPLMTEVSMIQWVRGILVTRRAVHVHIAVHTYVYCSSTRILKALDQEVNLLHIAQTLFIAATHAPFLT